MANKDYNEKEIIDKKVEETWYLLKDIENELNSREDITKSEKMIRNWFFKH